MQIGHQLQIGLHGEFGIEGRVFGKIADSGLHAQEVCVDIKPVDPDIALIRLQVAGQRLDQSGLSGAVGAKQTDDFAIPDFKCKGAQGLDRAIRLGEIAYLDHPACSCS